MTSNVGVVEIIRSLACVTLAAAQCSCGSDDRPRTQGILDQLPESGKDAVSDPSNPGASEAGVWDAGRADAGRDAALQTPDAHRHPAYGDAFSPPADAAPRPPISEFCGDAIRDPVLGM